MRFKVSVVATALVVGGSFGSMAPAVATGGVNCGDVVSHNVTLTRNLTCTGDGLTVAEGANVRIDLNGYTLRGSGTGLGISNGSPTSATNPVHYIAGLTVRNGTVTGFGAGISANGAVGPVRVQSARLLNNRVGVFAAGSPGSVGPASSISGSAFRGNDQGAVVGNATIDTSIFDNNAVGASELADQSGTATVTSSAFTSNGTGMTCSDGALYVSNSAFRGNDTGIGDRNGGGTSFCNVHVTGSSFSGGQVGIRMSFWALGWIRNSVFADSTIGVDMAGTVVQTQYPIEGNTFVHNGASGLFMRTLGGTAAVTGNKFKYNGFAPGTTVTPSGAPLNAGVWADKGVFTNNLAIGNAGYGIEGYGVTDGGGNVAQGNGQPAQCLGVTCTG